ncbi:MAG TPA: FkbM family methyltransferase [Prosthecobacter sp.]|nr:FkbM family methyltransferase [Prosthecobacter sp.]HRK14161.1 FkbM family methyltransferase [Prosthecobacter sp.]
MRLSPSDSFHGEIAFCGIYEADESRAIHMLAKEQGGLLVDVGANYGYYTLLWCAARPDNRAVAIEASPRNAQALRENVARNNLTSRVRVVECAVTRETGRISFDLGSAEETGWGGIASGLEGGTISVPAERLDRLVSEPVRVLKVDCEGADAWVVEGATALLDSGNISHVFFEENVWRQERLGIAAGSAQDRLRRAGFEIQGIGKGPPFANHHASHVSSGGC